MRRIEAVGGDDAYRAAYHHAFGVPPRLLEAIAAAPDMIDSMPEENASVMQQRFIPGSFDIDEIADAVIRRLVVTEPGVRSAVVRDEYGERLLTTRQVEVLELLSQGMTNSEVAVKLWLSLNTVKTHSKAIIRRLGAKNFSHAVRIAMRRGLIG